MSLDAEAWQQGVQKALGSWNAAKHPRGRDGKFLEVGDLVGIWSGPDGHQTATGRVVAGHFSDDGRMYIGVEHEGESTVQWYRPKQVGQVNPKADLTPDGPIPDVGGKPVVVPWDGHDAAGAYAAQKMALTEIKKAFHPDDVAHMFATTQFGIPTSKAGFGSATDIAFHDGSAKPVKPTDLEQEATDQAAADAQDAADEAQLKAEQSQELIDAGFLLGEDGHITGMQGDPDGLMSAEEQWAADAAAGAKEFGGMVTTPYQKTILLGIVEDALKNGFDPGFEIADDGDMLGVLHVTDYEIAKGSVDQVLKKHVEGGTGWAEIHALQTAMQATHDAMGQGQETADAKGINANLILEAEQVPIIQAILDHNTPGKDVGFNLHGNELSVTDWEEAINSVDWFDIETGSTDLTGPGLDIKMAIESAWTAQQYPNDMGEGPTPGLSYAIHGDVPVSGAQHELVHDIIQNTIGTPDELGFTAYDGAVQVTNHKNAIKMLDVVVAESGVGPGDPLFSNIKTLKIQIMSMVNAQDSGQSYPTKNNGTGIVDWIPVSPAQHELAMEVIGMNLTGDGDTGLATPGGYLIQVTDYQAAMDSLQMVKEHLAPEQTDFVTAGELETLIDTYYEMQHGTVEADPDPDPETVGLNHTLPLTDPQAVLLDSVGSDVLLPDANPHGVTYNVQWVDSQPFLQVIDFKTTEVILKDIKDTFDPGTIPTYLSALLQTLYAAKMDQDFGDTEDPPGGVISLNPTQMWAVKDLQEMGLDNGMEESLGFVLTGNSLNVTDAVQATVQFDMWLEGFPGLESTAALQQLSYDIKKGNYDSADAVVLHLTDKSAAMFRDVTDHWSEYNHAPGGGLGFVFAHPDGQSIKVIDFDLAAKILTQALTKYEHGSPWYAAAQNMIDNIKDSAPEPAPAWIPGQALTPGQLYVLHTIAASFDTAGGEPDTSGFSVNGDKVIVYDHVKLLQAIQSHEIHDPSSAFAKDAKGLEAILKAPTGYLFGEKPAPAPDLPTVKLPSGKTPADVIWMVAQSAEGKNLPQYVLNQVNLSISAALADPDPIFGQKKLATAMTLAKLGGKQRARYRTLLDMHHGNVKATPQVPTSAGSGAKGAMSAKKIPGALNMTKASEYVNSGSASAGAAKSSIQSQITALMTDLETSHFVLALQEHPEFNSSQAGRKLAEAYAALTSGGQTQMQGTLRRDYSGNWNLDVTHYGGNYSGSGADVAPTIANLDQAIRETVVNALIQTWAGSSNDNSPRSLAMQDLAIEEFNLPSEFIFNWHSSPAGLQEHTNRHRELYRRFLREQYNHTQAHFKSKGIKAVRLRRGVKSAPRKVGGGTLNNLTNVGTISMRPLSSYSSRMAIATRFGKFVHEADVPIERIIGSAVTGFGCQSEYEFVVLGGDNTVTVVKDGNGY